MGNRGRLIAPGGLRDELAEMAEDEPAAGEALAEMAAQYGLTPSSARPGLVSYLARVWQRRHFILAYATARNVSMYTEARLGQLWQVLTPLLNSAVYYLIFGILFKANRGISNYTAYLVTGVFIFASRQTRSPLRRPARPRGSGWTSRPPAATGRRRHAARSWRTWC
jgi:teichoic acid transport system permease protein